MTDLEREDIESIARMPIGWERLKNKTVLIAGGTGFLGGFLIDVFRYRNEVFGDNIRVLALSRHPRENERNIVYLRRDICEKIETDEAVSFVLHLASNTHPRQYASDPVGTIAANVFGCYRLLELAREKRAERFLLASSVEIYGAGHTGELREEDCGYIDSNTARAGYNEAKRVSESLCASYAAQYGVSYVIARLARCFGADRKEDSKALAQFMRNALNGRDVELTSKGGQRFSYCYVADAAGGILKALLDGKDGEAYNVSGEDEGKTLGDYARLIAAEAGREAVFRLGPNANLGVSAADRAIVNCDKLKALGWKPLYPVSEGIVRTMRIYRLRERA